MRKDGAALLDAVCSAHPLGQGVVDARWEEAPDRSDPPVPERLGAPQVEASAAPVTALDVVRHPEGSSDPRARSARHARRRRGGDDGGVRLADAGPARVTPELHRGALRGRPPTRRCSRSRRGIGHGRRHRDGSGAGAVPAGGLRARGGESPQDLMGKARAAMELVKKVTELAEAFKPEKEGGGGEGGHEDDGRRAEEEGPDDEDPGDALARKLTRIGEGLAPSRGSGGSRVSPARRSTGPSATRPSPRRRPPCAALPRRRRRGRR